MKKLSLAKNVMVVVVAVCSVAVASVLLQPKLEWKTEPLPEAPQLQEPLQPRVEKVKEYAGPNCKLENQLNLNQVIKELDQHPEWKDAQTQEFIIYSLPECVGSWYEVNEMRNGLRYIGRIYKQKPSALKGDMHSFIYSGYVHGYAPAKISPLFEKYGLEDHFTVIY